MRCGFVAVLGRTNVGKSTIVNGIVGSKVAIVTDRTQTTIWSVRGIRTTPEHQIVFVDTPGLHRPRSRWGEELLGRARRALAEVDAVLAVVEAGDRLAGGTQHLVQAVQAAGRPAILCINKIDVHAPEEIELTERELRPACDWQGVFRTAAVRGEGLGALEAALAALLPESAEPLYPPGQTTDLPERLMLAEIIREQAMLLTRQEVPHAVAVRIERTEARPDGTLYIEAVLYCERETQKGILVGKGGRTIKAIGSRAREQIEALTGRRVYLDLRVKVAPDWRDDPERWRLFGYA
ncbi:MAG: GTPase Era [Planctomycetota bacterium]|nr:MAG: GTPase Era [Planctomycetota bacterium]